MGMWKKDWYTDSGSGLLNQQIGGTWKFVSRMPHFKKAATVGNLKYAQNKSK